MHSEITLDSNFKFNAKVRDHSFTMDTQIPAGGTNAGPSPKELLLTSVIGCAGMDVSAIFKKYRVTPNSLTIKADAETRANHPKIFTKIEIFFEASGSEITPEVFIEAVRGSLTKFCGVSAMVNKVVPIYYRIVLNQAEIGNGEAKFEI